MILSIKDNPMVRFGALSERSRGERQQASPIPEDREKRIAQDALFQKIIRVVVEASGRDVSLTEAAKQYEAYEQAFVKIEKKEHLEPADLEAFKGALKEYGGLGRTAADVKSTPLFDSIKGCERIQDGLIALDMVSEIETFQKVNPDFAPDPGRSQTP